MPLKFTEADYLTAPVHKVYFDSTEIPDLGISTHETGALSKKYLVSFRDAQIYSRTFVRYDGQQIWVIENGGNDKTVDFRTAGLWTTGTLLPGNMMTLHDTAEAQQLMRWFRAAMKKEGFQKLDMWWLGREALEMLKSGKRLASDAEQSPREFDLKILE